LKRNIINGRIIKQLPSGGIVELAFTGKITRQTGDTREIDTLLLNAQFNASESGELKLELWLED